MIEDYKFGSITIGGKTYNQDLIIHADKILNDRWRRVEGHSIAIEDLKDFPEKFEVLVIGNGASGCCDVPAEILDFFEQKGCKVIVQITSEAAQTYNKLLSEGKDVVGAFHLTC